MDVAPDSGPLSNAFQTELRPMMDSIQMSSPLTGVVVFPTILNPSIGGSIEDSVKNKRDSSVWIALNIPHARWMEASPLEKVDLFAQNISNSFNKIAKTRLGTADRVKLLGLVETARENVRKNYQNSSGAKRWWARQGLNL